MKNQATIRAAIRRATLLAQKAMDRLDVKTQNEIRKMYQLAAADLQKRITAAAGGDGNLALSRLQSLLGQVRFRLNALSSERDGGIEAGLREAAQLGISPLTAAGTGEGGQGMLSGSAAMRISDEALRTVHAFVAADGLQLSDRIWRLDRHAMEIITGAIEMAVIQGHGATQAARELLSRGNPVPADLADKMNAANASAVGSEVASLLTGTGSPMTNAMRLMRTEINRAHGEAYIAGVTGLEGFAGLRFLLSPQHPEHDICDLHAEANLHGLGAGVYPDRKTCPWPAHPNTLSYVEVVFEDEISDQDRAGKETVSEALARLPPEQRKGVLGVNKARAFDAGGLRKNMIRSSWRSVQKQIGLNAKYRTGSGTNTSASYEAAKSGGRHHGFYLKSRMTSDRELIQAIRSFNRRIEQHQRWINNPTTKSSEYQNFDARRKVSLRDRWQRDIDRHREFIGIIKNLLQDRKNGKQ